MLPYCIVLGIFLVLLLLLALCAAAHEDEAGGCLSERIIGMDIHGCVLERKHRGQHHCACGLLWDDRSSRLQAAQAPSVIQSEAR